MPMPMLTPMQTPMPTRTPMQMPTPMPTRPVKRRHQTLRGRTGERFRFGRTSTSMATMDMC